MKMHLNNKLNLQADSSVSAFGLPSRQRNIIVGGFGSGKTEVSVNWAISLAQRGVGVKLADLDIANPYFRSREAQLVLQQAGVTPVIPVGDVQFSDLPVLIPQIKGMMQNEDKDVSFFDVGGDVNGAKVLASLRTALGHRSYSLYQVINTRRPFTSTAKGCVEMKSKIEAASGLQVTGFILNTHLMDETNEAVILEGISIAKEAAAQSGISICFMTLMEGDWDTRKLKKAVECPIHIMNRKMLPPWLNQDALHSWPMAVINREGIN